MASNLFTFLRSKALMLCSILLVLSIPFELSILSFELPWGRGFSNPYTTIHFGVWDFLLFLTGIFFFVERRNKRGSHGHGHPQIYLLFLSFLVCVFLSFFFSPRHEPLYFLLLSIKLLELLFFYKILCTKHVDQIRLVKVLIYALCLQSVIAIVQVLTQNSVGLYSLGEPHLWDSSPHLARFVLKGLTLVRGYGTFPHPNILGGFLVFGILGSFFIRPSFRYERVLLLGVQFLGLLVTFSRSAELGLALALVLILFWNWKRLKQSNNKIIPLVLLSLFIIEFTGIMVLRRVDLFQEVSFLERWEGFKNAWELFTTYPLGLGFSSFTLFLDEVSNTPLMPWEYQPVHNIYLLVLAELGIPGLFIVMIGLFVMFHTLHELWKFSLTPLQRFKKQALFCMILFLLLVGMFDHYLLSLEQGRILSVMMAVLISKFCHQPMDVKMLKREGSLSKILAGLE